MWPIRNDPAVLWLTEVNSYMQSKHIFFRSLTESGSTEMKEWVKDWGVKPPARDSPWWNSPSCSSLAGRDKRWVKCLLLPDVSDARLDYLSACCDQWAAQCRHWLCASATGRCRLSTCTGLFRRCTDLNGAAQKARGFSQLNDHLPASPLSKKHIHCVAELQDTWFNLLLIF